VTPELLLRAAGGLVALAAGFVAGLLAVLLVPLRLDTFGAAAGVIGDAAGGGWAAARVPVAILLAVFGNLALLWFGREATGNRWGVLLPGVGWFAMIVVALRTTTEGDRLLVPDDWVATLTLFGGTLVLVIGSVLAITPGRAAGPTRRAGSPYHR
jgi:hypothetical protein